MHGSIYLSIYLWRLWMPVLLWFNCKWYSCRMKVWTCSFLPCGCKIITRLLRDNRNFLSLGFFLSSIEKSFRFCQSQPVAIDNLVLKARHDCRRWKMEWEGITGSDVCWGDRTNVNPLWAHCSAREFRRENEMNSTTQLLRVFSAQTALLLCLMFVFLEMLHDVKWCRF